MAATSPEHQAIFRAKLDSALKIASKAVTSKTRRAKKKLFGVWADFRQEFLIPASLYTMAMLRTSSPTCSSSPCDTTSMGNVTSLSELIQSRPRSPQWAWGYPTWVSKIPASRLDQTNSIPYSMILSGPSTRTTGLQGKSTLQTSPSSEACSL
jgi:hypothetical protein